MQKMHPQICTANTVFDFKNLKSKNLSKTFVLEIIMHPSSRWKYTPAAQISTIFPIHFSVMPNQNVLTLDDYTPAAKFRHDTKCKQIAKIWSISRPKFYTQNTIWSWLELHPSSKVSIKYTPAARSWARLFFLLPLMWTYSLFDPDIFYFSRVRLNLSGFG